MRFVRWILPPAHSCNKSSICLTTALQHYPPRLPPPFVSVWATGSCHIVLLQLPQSDTSLGVKSRALRPLAELVPVIIVCQEANTWAHPLHGILGEVLSNWQLIWFAVIKKCLFDFSVKRNQIVICFSILVLPAVLLLLCRGFPNFECLWKISSSRCQCEAATPLLVYVKHCKDVILCTSPCSWHEMTWSLKLGSLLLSWGLKGTKLTEQKISYFFDLLVSELRVTEFSWSLSCKCQRLQHCASYLFSQATCRTYDHSVN